MGTPQIICMLYACYCMITVLYYTQPEHNIYKQANSMRWFTLYAGTICQLRPFFFNYIYNIYIYIYILCIYVFLHDKVKMKIDYI